MQIIIENKVRKTISKWSNSKINKILDFLSKIENISLDDLMSSDFIKKYKYSNDGIFVLRYKNYRLFCTIGESEEHGEFLFIQKIVNRRELV